MRRTIRVLYRGTTGKAPWATAEHWRSEDRGEGPS